MINGGIRTLSYVWNRIYRANRTVEYYNNNNDNNNNRNRIITFLEDNVYIDVEWEIGRASCRERV